MVMFGREGWKGKISGRRKLRKISKNMVLGKQGMLKENENNEVKKTRNIGRFKCMKKKK